MKIYIIEISIKFSNQIIKNNKKSNKFFDSEEKVNDIPNICHSVPGTSTKQYRYNMPPVALVFPSTWKSPIIPPAYAKKTRIPILRTLEVRMQKFAYVRWFAYAMRQEYQISVRTQKTCVRKDKNTAPERPPCKAL